MAPSRGASCNSSLGLRQPRGRISAVVAIYCMFLGESVRPEFESDMRRLSVQASGTSIFEDFQSAKPSFSDISSVPRGGQEVAGTTSTDATSCETYFLTPSNWRLSLHLGQGSKGGLAAAAAEKGALLGIVQLAQAFSSAPAVVESEQKGIYLRPTVDAWTPHWIFTRFGCKFEGDVRLSLNESCEGQPATASGSTPITAEKGEFLSIKADGGELTAFRLSAPRRLLVAAKQNATDVLSNQAVDMQLYLCVKPGTHSEWHPLTLLWYFRDADGKTARALNPQENQIPHMFRGWRYASGLTFSEPLAEERLVPTCMKTRWNRFLELDEVHRSGCDVGSADCEALHEAAKDAVAGTPCEERSTQGMRPHSAIVMQFARSKVHSSQTSPVMGGISTHAVAPGSKKTMHA